MTDISLETYAHILARLACQRGERIERVLADMGIAPEDFREGEASLRAQLAESWPQRKGIFAMKFATALGEELERLGPLAHDNSASPPAAAPREPDVVIPSYLREPMAPVSSMPMSLPSAIADLLAADKHPPRPSLAATMDADLSAIVASIQRGALPFAPGGDAPKQDTNPPSVGAPPSRATAPTAPGATLELPASPAPEDSDLSAFPLELYASVTGALARGESRDEALAKHHLSAEAFDKLTKAWAPRFAKEPHLLARFKELAKISAAGRRGDP